MGIFQQDGTRVIIGQIRDEFFIAHTSVIVEYQVEVIAFTWIESEPEIADKVICCADILNKQACRQFSAEHV